MLCKKAKDHSIGEEIPADVLRREKIRGYAIAGIVLHIAINPDINTNSKSKKKKQTNLDR